jgi:hypothetical protein
MITVLMSVVVAETTHVHDKSELHVRASKGKTLFTLCTYLLYTLQANIQNLCKKMTYLFILIYSSLLI